MKSLTLVSRSFVLWASDPGEDSKRWREAVWLLQTDELTFACARKGKRDCILYSFGPLFLDIDVYFLPMVLKHFCRLRLIVKNNPKLVWFCFAILFEILWYKLMQIRCEPKLFMTWSRVFCRAMRSHWFILLLTFIVTTLVWVYDGQMLKKKIRYFIFIFSVIATRTTYNTSYTIWLLTPHEYYSQHS